MKHFRCSHNQKQPPHICLFCPVETKTSNDLYRHITDVHQKKTDELRPSLLAARSDAQQATKEQQERQQAQDELQQSAKQIQIVEQQTEQPQEEEDEEEEVRYAPITEDIEFEEETISPCYVVLPFVTDEECEAARNPPPQNVS